MIRTIDIEVRDSAFDPDLSPEGQNVHYRVAEPRRYRVFLYLDGEDLPYVDRVTYHLHETFRQPKRVVRRTPSNPNCKLVLWTWGVFQVRAVVEDKRGEEYGVFHDLSYDRAFKALPSKRFEAVSPTSGGTPVA